MFPSFLSKCRLSFLTIISLSISVLLAACSPGSTSSGQNVAMASLSQMPAEVQAAPVSVQEGYRFAVANPDVLKSVPCYCGCKATGHTSNYSCFVKDASSPNGIVYDNHALGCSMCVEIARDAMRMTREGKPINEIRTSIDQIYSKYGPSNMPALQ
ncbi:MAG: PCYCGC motif-containing (lipo)protein [Chloroflexota bacterium]